MMVNWKTTMAGVAVILTALGEAIRSIVSGEGISGDTVVQIVAGVGLILARDHKPAPKA